MHLRYYGGSLLPEFWDLVECLDEMARRWAGPVLRERQSSCLAGKYASELRSLHHRCDADPALAVDVLGYSIQAGQEATSYLATGNKVKQHGNEHSPEQPPTNQAPVRISESAVAHLQQSGMLVGSPVRLHSDPTLPMAVYENDAPDELSAISRMLLDHRFMEMDRVISFDNMMFSAQIPISGTHPTLDVDGWTGI